MKIKPHQRINKQTDPDGTPRVHPNTHCPGIGKLKGLQWVGANATLCLGGYNTDTEGINSNPLIIMT